MIGAAVGAAVAFVGSKIAKRVKANKEAKAIEAQYASVKVVEEEEDEK